jgi:hypothetical protein
MDFIAGGEIGKGVRRKKVTSKLIAPETMVFVWYSFVGLMVVFSLL